MNITSTNLTSEHDALSAVDISDLNDAELASTISHSPIMIPGDLFNLFQADPVPTFRLPPTFLRRHSMSLELPPSRRCSFVLNLDSVRFESLLHPNEFQLPLQLKDDSTRRKSLATEPVRRDSNDSLISFCNEAFAGIRAQPDLFEFELLMSPYRKDNRKSKPIVLQSQGDLQAVFDQMQEQKRTKALDATSLQNRSVLTSSSTNSDIDNGDYLYRSNTSVDTRSSSAPKQSSLASKSSKKRSREREATATVENAFANSAWTDEVLCSGTVITCNTSKKHVSAAIPSRKRSRSKASVANVLADSKEVLCSGTVTTCNTSKKHGSAAIPSRKRSRSKASVANVFADSEWTEEVLCSGTVITCNINKERVSAQKLFHCTDEVLCSGTVTTCSTSKKHESAAIPSRKRSRGPQSTASVSNVFAASKWTEEVLYSGNIKRSFLRPIQYDQ